MVSITPPDTNVKNVITGSLTQHTPLNDLVREVQLLKQITTGTTTDLHPSSSTVPISFLSPTNLIVNYIDSYFYHHQLWLVTEYMDGGSLADLLQAIGSSNSITTTATMNTNTTTTTYFTFTEECIADALCFVVHGLVFLHSHRIVHRDLKAGNILLTSDGKAKLADFGVAVQLNNTVSKRRTLIGSPYWMAPEVVLESSYAYPADIWSLGITALELAEGSPPLANVHPMRAIFLIAAREAPFLTHPEQWSTNFQQFLRRCLQKNPNDRATAEELLHHPFLSSAYQRIIRDHGLSLYLADLLDRIIPLLDEQRQELQAQDQLRKKAEQENKNTVTRDNSNEDREAPKEIYTPVDTKGETSNSIPMTTTTAPFSSGTMIYHHSRTSDPNNIVDTSMSSSGSSRGTAKHGSSTDSMVINEDTTNDTNNHHLQGKENVLSSPGLPSFVLQASIRMEEEELNKRKPSSNVPFSSSSSSSLSLPPIVVPLLSSTTAPFLPSSISSSSLPPAVPVTVPIIRPDIYSTLSDSSFVGIVARISNVDQLKIQLQALNMQYQRDTTTLNQKYRQAYNVIQERLDTLTKETASNYP